MKTSLFAISSRTLATDAEAVKRLMSILAPQHPRITLKIDNAALDKRVEGMPALEALPVVDVHALVREETGDYLVNEVAVAELLSHVTAQHLLILDAGAFQLDVLKLLLGHMRRVLFSQPAWPGAIGVVVREETLTAATAALSRAFYLTPSRVSVQEAAAFTLRVHRTARLARLMTLTQGATFRAFTVKSRMTNAYNRLMRRDDIDLT